MKWACLYCRAGTNCTFSFVTPTRGEISRTLVSNSLGMLHNEFQMRDWMIPTPDHDRVAIVRHSYNAFFHMRLTYEGLNRTWVV